MILKKSILLVTIIILFTAGVVSINAGEEGHACMHGCMPGKYEMVTITGLNYCPACNLKFDAGAQADCKTYGHHHALRVVKLIDFCGEEKAEFVGKTLFYLENNQSAELINGHQNETVIVQGKMFLTVPMVEVNAVELPSN